MIEHQIELQTIWAPGRKSHTQVVPFFVSLYHLILANTYNSYSLLSVGEENKTSTFHRRTCFRQGNLWRGIILCQQSSSTQVWTECP